MQKKMVLILAVFLALIGLNPLVNDCWPAESPPAEDGVLPDFKLPVPQRQDERLYLGTGPDGHFKVPQIKAQVVILEIFSMYCPFCQKEAPSVNELFEAIEKRRDLRDKIKMVGIGAGNSPFEVNAFRNLYHIDFPLFPDTNFSLHKAFGQVRTPYFIVVKINPNGTHRVIYSKVGSFGDPHQFLEFIIQKSQIK